MAHGREDHVAGNYGRHCVLFLSFEDGEGKSCRGKEGCVVTCVKEVCELVQVHSKLCIK